MKTLIKITINHEKTMTAEWEDNEAARELIRRMPFTIQMDNLYGREMCHRYGHGALRANEAKDKDYKVGDISYWPPMGSLVILYKQNGEIFEQQPIGHIDSDISFFNRLKSAEVRFEVKK
jgi:hypothetical protein